MNCNPFTNFLCNTNLGTWLFQDTLGWNIVESTAFCSGVLVFAIIAVWAIGRQTGYSRDTVFDTSKNNRPAEVSRGFFLPLVVVMVIVFIVAVLMLVTL